MGTDEHDFFRQWAMLENYVARPASDCGSALTSLTLAKVDSFQRLRSTLGCIHAQTASATAELRTSAAMPLTEDLLDFGRSMQRLRRVKRHRRTIIGDRGRSTTFMPKGGRMDADPAGLPLPRADITSGNHPSASSSTGTDSGRSTTIGVRLRLGVNSTDSFVFDGVRT